MRQLQRLHKSPNARNNDQELFDKFTKLVTDAAESFCQDPEYKDLEKFIKTVTLNNGQMPTSYYVPDNQLIHRLIGDAPPWPLPDDYVVYTPNVYTDPTVLDHSNYVLSHPAFYANKYWHRTEPIKNTTPTKSFNCFIKRLDPIRQSWFYLLIRNQLLDQGYVSFLMDASRAPGELQNRPDVFFEYCHDTYLREFDVERQYCLNNHLLPYQNFNRPFRHFNNNDLDDIIVDSRFSIVIETYFNSESITFTEKIFRVLLLPRPWLLFCTRGAVALLRSWGLDVLDDLVDHNRYDNADSEIDRQSIIIQMSKEMLLFDTEKHQVRLEQAAQHNIDLINYWYNNWPELLRPSVEQAIVKVNRVLKKLQNQNKI